MGEKKQEKILEGILGNEAEFKRLLSAKNKEEVKEIFKEKGMDLTDDQVDSLKEVLVAIFSKVKELNPAELEEISGGGRPEKYGVTGAGAGLVVGVTVGAAAGIISGIRRELKSDSSFTTAILRTAGKAAVGAAVVGSVYTALGGVSGVAAGIARDASEGNLPCWLGLH